MNRRFVPAEVSIVGEDQVRIRMTTDQRARDGHILDPAGCVLDNYRGNPIVLWQHDPEEPVGTNAEITVAPNGIDALTTFAPMGVSTTADKVRGLVKAGVVRGVSIGFDIIEGEPIEPARPRAGLRVSKWELLECSFVSIPADTGASVTAREAGAAPADAPAPQARAAGQRRAVRGLYDCAQLAYVLGQIGWLHEGAAFEAEIEGDGSKVPAMLGDALKSLGETLIAMTAEEVGELLDGHGVGADDGDDDALPEAERTYLRKATSPRARAWRAGIVYARAGKALSGANEAMLAQAQGHMTKAATRADTAASCHRSLNSRCDQMGDLHARAAAAHDKASDALNAANGAPPEEVTAAIAKAQKHHRAVGKHLDALGDQINGAGDDQQDAQDAVTGCARSMRAAMRCVRTITGEDDDDVTDIQTSEGDGESDGSAVDRSFRRRRAALLELAAAQ